MQNLNPTLWRTCRVLAGTNRIKLLRHLHEHPGQNIANLAEALGISRPYASQEMRRIQSRGLLKPIRQGAALVYVPSTDPQVASAKPLLKALQASLNAFPAARDGELVALATGLAHERRIAIARSLLQGPKTRAELLTDIPMVPCSYSLHLRKLVAAGFVARRGQRLCIQTPDHPLGRALANLLREEPSK